MSNHACLRPRLASARASGRPLEIREGEIEKRRLAGQVPRYFGALDIAAIKDALSGLEGHLDHRPVSVQLDEPAAVASIPLGRVS
jgi:hypothetical protein